jgi:ribonuclease HI
MNPIDRKDHQHSRCSFRRRYSVQWKTRHIKHQHFRP